MACGSTLVAMGVNDVFVSVTQEFWFADSSLVVVGWGVGGSSLNVVWGFLFSCSRVLLSNSDLGNSSLLVM